MKHDKKHEHDHKHVNGHPETKHPSGGDDLDAICAITKKEEQELRKKAAERDDFYNKWMMVHAEYENTRRRLEKEKIDRIRFANEEMIENLIPLVDNFDMALDAMEKAQDKAAVMDGIRIVLRQFHKILDDNGVKRSKQKESISILICTKLSSLSRPMIIPMAL